MVCFGGGWFSGSGPAIVEVPPPGVVVDAGVAAAPGDGEAVGSPTLGLTDDTGEAEEGLTLADDSGATEEGLTLATMEGSGAGPEQAVRTTHATIDETSLIMAAPPPERRLDYSV
ncbi:hypothetical protein GCM10022275_28330 [Tessaracoccus defluvii]